ncbi:hypothetical protein GCK32_006707 [Trichostrongylus colubriformis]|uniref:Uncharacterized protein n=1 Tax=Trichostrongylus colubriformis TaxID=6319 RepID=A0AAN8FB36_TRICO
MRCGLACLYERRNIRKDLARWSRTTLLAAGIENIACHFVGLEAWEAIFPESSVCLNQQGLDPADFEPAEQCLLCDRQRGESAATSTDNKVSV